MDNQWGWQSYSRYQLISCICHVVYSWVLLFVLVLLLLHICLILANTCTFMLMHWRKILDVCFPGGWIGCAYLPKAALDRMPSFIHEERSVLVGLDGKGTFLVVTWLCKATRTGPSPLHVGPLFSLASPATKPLHTRFQVEEKENAAKIEFQTCLLASKVMLASLFFVIIVLYTLN